MLVVLRLGSRGCIRSWSMFPLNLGKVGIFWGRYITTTCGEKKYKGSMHEGFGKFH